MKSAKRTRTTGDRKSSLPSASPNHPPPPPFLKVAAIPELLRLIIDHLSPSSSSLYHLAATCRLLFEPSAAALWQVGSDDRLQQFVDLLPANALLLDWRGRGTSKRYAWYQKSDLDRLLLYHRFIHTLDITERLRVHDLEPLQTVSTLLPGASILPNLRILSISYAVANSWLTHLLLSPSVVHLVLRVPEDANRDWPEIPQKAVHFVLEWLPDRSPHLECLDLSWTLDWVYDTQPIANALRRLQQLREVTIRGIGFSTPILRAMLDLPHLCTLTLSGYQDAFGNVVASEVAHALSGRSFDFLRTLDCTGNMDVCAAIVERCPRLERLFLFSIWESEEQTIVCAKNWTVHGGIHHFFIAFNDDVAPALWTCLQPLNTLPIRDFCVWVNKWQPRPEKFEGLRLLTQWPTLRRLTLHVGECDGPTLSDLLHLLKCCPELQSIALDVLSSDAHPIRERGLEPFRLARLKIERTDVPTHTLVRFLSVACPEVVVEGFEADDINQRLAMIRYAASVAAGTADFTF